MSTGTFQHAHDFLVTNSQFTDVHQTLYSPTFNSETINTYHIIPEDRLIRLKALLDASIPDAFHDSSARDPPPKCHPGTRCDYIDKIISWATNGDKCTNHDILWVSGPAGVGKSAVAQSCAESLGCKLGAAFFFSEFNRRQDSKRFFTSISYQLATKVDAYGDIVDHKMRRDPALVGKAPTHQFQDLIVAPLNELAARGEGASELVIIIDGLDECAGVVAQLNIVNIVANSVQNHTTPLRWIFFSRPEAHIVASFTSSSISQMSYHMEIPVSRQIDNEIAKYLTDELGKVGQEHGLPDSWPSERDIGTLVDRSAGLFIYAAAVVRFVREPDSSGPEDQLRFVLASRRPSSDNAKHPLSELDIFYTLIMQRVLPTIRPITKKILLATTFSSTETDVLYIANLLSLSQSQFRNACRGLHSVLELINGRVRFYHASFMEFLQDPERSGDLCIRSDCAMALRGELLNKLNQVHATSESGDSINISLTWPGYNTRHAYDDLLAVFFELCQSVPLDVQTLVGLSTFDYGKIPVLHWSVTFLSGELNTHTLQRKIPQEYHTKIIRPYRYHYLFGCGQFQKPWNAKWSRPYVLGKGKKKALCWETPSGGSVVGVHPRLHEAAIVKFMKRKFMWWRGTPGASDAPETSSQAPDDVLSSLSVLQTVMRLDNVQFEGISEQRGPVNIRWVGGSQPRDAELGDSAPRAQGKKSAEIEWE